MTTKKGEEIREATTEPALRVIVRRLREIMAEPDEGQGRLDKIVRQIAGLMIAEVCSLYVKRQDGSLELFATEGLNQSAVHHTLLNRGEGLIGRCAELASIVNEPEAKDHPAFSYRPETGEELYHSMLAVPVLRAGAVLGVLAVQNRTQRIYSEEDIEVLQTTAMLIAEYLLSGTVPGVGGEERPELIQGSIVKCQQLSDGIALGHVVLHEPRVAVTTLFADNPLRERDRLTEAVAKLRAWLEDTLAHETLTKAGAHREVLEAYSMFANDDGWVRRMQEAVNEGLTAEAAVERVHNASRARMLSQSDRFWHERLRDLDDLSDRLLRILAGRTSAADNLAEMPDDAILVARTMGPAELFDYDRTKLRGLIIEDSATQSHVAIVARALGLAAVGKATGVVERVSTGDAAIVDAEAGEVHIRPTPEVVNAYADKVRFQARRQQRYRSLRDTPAVTRDGHKIGLYMNAGLLVDMPNLKESGSEAIGLFRTELQFMLSESFPRIAKQIETYQQVLDEAEGTRVVFRALDIGGDKELPYLRHPHEQNPALGWRAIRLALDRPGLMRLQVRALLRAAAGRELDLMFPMVSVTEEFLEARARVHREMEWLAGLGYRLPDKVRLGAMIEVPSLLFELDCLMPHVDFVSVGSNDLLQFLFAADRNNAQVGARYDALTVTALRALRTIAEAGQRHGVPVTLCGEMAGRPLEAMALIGLGFRAISMAPASIGPVKAMILSLDAGALENWLHERLRCGNGSLRGGLVTFAGKHGVEL
ncbi:MAG: hypothetical protein RLZ98_2504 [Pseudomonadota bacterium]|jgi:phosphotransferase system enzyme I (PtsP)